MRWFACFQSFQLAAHANDMWTYSASTSHLRVCLQIACRAHVDKRRHQLAQFYDATARHEWNEKAERGARFGQVHSTHACIIVVQATLTSTLTRRA